MKILVLSNLYPPHSMGGYEERCRDVVEGLRRRGHQVSVLTSDFQRDDRPASPRQTPELWRQLQLTWFQSAAGSPQELALRIERDLEVLQAMLREHRPELLYIWSTSGLFKSLLVYLAGCSLPTLFDIADYSLISELRHDLWLKYWRKHPDARPEDSPEIAGLEQLSRCHYGRMEDPRQLVRWACYPSRFVESRYERAGFSPARSAVVPCGIPLEDFVARPLGGGPPRRLLFAGNIRFDKGAHTALEALGLLRDEYEGLSLSLVGDHFSGRYRRRLEGIIAAYGLEQRVELRSFIPRAQMPALYRSHDVLLFPSIWEEPFGMIPIEAMASGIAVVSTTRGGCSEWLREGVNGLSFAADSPASLADALRRLLEEPGLYASLCREGPKVAAESYSAHAMIERMHELLMSHPEGSGRE